MKKKVINLIIFVLLVMMFGCLFAYLWPKAKNEAFETEGMDLEEIFTKKGHYYVYFYRGECRYCTNIEVEIDAFANNVELYRVNTELLNNTQEYDWEQHGAEFDVEIGRVGENGNIEYYNNLNEKDVMEIFPPDNYYIIIATEGYAAIHNGKEEGKVYAISTHPFLSEDDLQVNNFVLPGVSEEIAKRATRIIRMEDGNILNTKASPFTVGHLTSI